MLKIYAGSTFSMFLTDKKEVFLLDFIYFINNCYYKALFLRNQRL